MATLRRSGLAISAEADRCGDILPVYVGRLEVGHWRLVSGRLDIGQIGPGRRLASPLRLDPKSHKLSGTQPPKPNLQNPTSKTQPPTSSTAAINFRCGRCVIFVTVDVG